MDLSEIGFKERYQSTLTSKHQRARDYIYQNDEASAKHEKVGAGSISNDYYILAEKEGHSPQPYQQPISRPKEVTAFEKYATTRQQQTAAMDDQGGCSGGTGVDLNGLAFTD